MSKTYAKLLLAYAKRSSSSPPHPSIETLTFSEEKPEVTVTCTNKFVFVFTFYAPGKVPIVTLQRPILPEASFHHNNCLCGLEYGIPTWDKQSDPVDMLYHLLESVLYTVEAVPAPALKWPAADEPSTVKIEWESLKSMAVLIMTHVTYEEDDEQQQQQQQLPPSPQTTKSVVTRNEEELKQAVEDPHVTEISILDFGSEVTEGNILSISRSIAFAIGENVTVLPSIKITGKHTNVVISQGRFRLERIESADATLTLRSCVITDLTLIATKHSVCNIMQSNLTGHVLATFGSTVTFTESEFRADTKLAGPVALCALHVDTSIILNNTQVTTSCEVQHGAKVEVHGTCTFEDLDEIREKPLIVVMFSSFHVFGTMNIRMRTAESALHVIMSRICLHENASIDAIGEGKKGIIIGAESGIHGIRNSMIMLKNFAESAIVEGSIVKVPKLVLESCGQIALQSSAMSLGHGSLLSCRVINLAADSLLRIQGASKMIAAPFEASSPFLICHSSKIDLHDGVEVTSEERDTVIASSILSFRKCSFNGRLSVQQTAMSAVQSQFVFHNNSVFCQGLTDLLECSIKCHGDTEEGFVMQNATFTCSACNIQLGSWLLQMQPAVCTLSRCHVTCRYFANVSDGSKMLVVDSTIDIIDLKNMADDIGAKGFSSRLSGGSEIIIERSKIQGKTANVRSRIVFCVIEGSEDGGQPSRFLMKDSHLNKCYMGVHLRRSTVVMDNCVIEDVEGAVVAEESEDVILRKCKLTAKESGIIARSCNGSLIVLDCECTSYTTLVISSFNTAVVLRNVVVTLNPRTELDGRPLLAMKVTTKTTKQQKSVLIAGTRFVQIGFQSNWDALLVENCQDVAIEDCKFEHFNGGVITTNSTVSMKQTTMTKMDENGVKAMKSTLNMTKCSIECKGLAMHICDTVVNATDSIFKSISFNGVHAEGNATRFAFEKCVVSCEKICLHVLNDAGGKITNTIINCNHVKPYTGGEAKSIGIVVAGGGILSVEKCRLNDFHVVGLVDGDTTEVCIDNSSATGFTGVAVSKKGRLTCINSKFKTVITACRASEGGTMALSRCQITNERENGVEAVQSGTTATVSNCDIEFNENAGVHVENHASCIVRETTIHGRPTIAMNHGIVATNHGSVIVSQCDISKVFSGVTAMINGIATVSRTNIEQVTFGVTSRERATCQVLFTNIHAKKSGVQVSLAAYAEVDGDYGTEVHGNTYAVEARGAGTRAVVRKTLVSSNGDYLFSNGQGEAYMDCEEVIFKWKAFWSHVLFAGAIALVLSKC